MECSLGLKYLVSDMISADRYTDTRIHMIRETEFLRLVKENLESLVDIIEGRSYLAEH